MSPGGVRLTPWTLRSNKSPPSRNCSRLICALTAGCVTPSLAAALVKLRKSTTATSVRSRSVGILVIGRTASTQDYVYMHTNEYECAGLYHVPIFDQFCGVMKPPPCVLSIVLM